jgi:serine/threonine protein kinase
MEDPNSHLKRIMNRYVFDVNQPLGFGTNSIVYVGTDETNNTKVAIKKLNKNIIQERISGEVEALKRCTSPYVVKIIAVTKDEDNVYLMTELCTGGDLKS